MAKEETLRGRHERSGPSEIGKPGVKEPFVLGFTSVSDCKERDKSAPDRVIAAPAETVRFMPNFGLHELSLSESLSELLMVFLVAGFV